MAVEVDIQLGKTPILFILCVFLTGCLFLGIAWFKHDRNEYIQEHSVITQATVTEKRGCSGSKQKSRSKKGVYYKWSHEWNEEAKTVTHCQSVSQRYFSSVDVGDTADVYYVPGKSKAYSRVEFRNPPIWMPAVGIILILFSFWGLWQKFRGLSKSKTIG